MRRILALCVVATCGLVLASCFNPFSPRVSLERVASVPAPSPTSPANLVKLFAWCWVNRDPAMYAEVFTDDYRFVFAPNDSAGNPFRDQPWLREDEMSMAQHLFVGGTDRPPASSIVVNMDNNLIALPDPRPGKDFRVHRSIRASVDVKVTITSADGTPDVQPISGRALFYLVRGDSAVIPAELIKLGFKPDSTRWWIERWEDETAGATAPNRARPTLPPGAMPAAGRRRTAAATTVLPPESFGQLKADWH